MFSRPGVEAPLTHRHRSQHGLRQVIRSHTLKSPPPFQYKRATRLVGKKELLLNQQRRRRERAFQALLPNFIPSGELKTMSDARVVHKIEQPVVDQG